MPNQRDIARHLGLSQSTVSFALRDSPLIAQATRELVHRAAAELGYHPNPMVASLMEHIRSGRPLADQGCLAILVDFANEAEWLSFHVAYEQQYAAIQRQAALRGYRTECFFLRGPGMSPATVDRILHSRGIVGVILAGPRKDSSYELSLEWSRYACARVGYTWDEPAVDCVAAHNRHHVELAFRELAQRGAKRIGFCLGRLALNRADRNWLAGHLISQYTLPEASRVPMFVNEGTPGERERFAEWLKRWKPDAIIGGTTEFAWLNELIPNAQKQPQFCARFHFPDSPVSAIEENNALIGETLCDLVIEQITHNKRGIPTHPRLILIEGSWHQGTTTRAT